jgi:hypothetical protein
MDLTKETTESTLDEFSIKITDYSHGGYGAVSGAVGHDYSTITSSITLPNSQDTITLSSSPYTTSGISVIGGLSNTFPYANTTSNIHPWLSHGISNDPASAGKLTLNGENADIEINGQSLLGMLRRMEDRLNIMVPNTKMEEEWDQLRELGEQYRALEAKLKEQGDMWAKLKAMPPPEIA